MADERMMDESDERPEDTAQFELIPGVTPGVPERSAYVSEEVDRLVPRDSE
jgi:hypothetical protein